MLIKILNEKIKGVSLVGASLFAKTSLVLLGTVAATYVTFLLSLMIKVH